VTELNSSKDAGRTITLGSEMEKEKDMLDAPKSVQRTSIGIDQANFVTEEQGSIHTRYTEQKMIGEGSYGRVYKMKNNMTGDMRAVKCIYKKAEFINKKEIDKEIANEIEILKQIDHPNILKIYEFYNSPQYYYLVTEFCEGGELFDHIINNGPFDEEYTSIIMHQILSAVNYCHKMKILHRDLKPENILFEDTAIRRVKDPNLKLSNLNIKIIDFGTAKIFDKNKKEKKVIGSSYYIAPEVLTKKYDEKCDLWSCGIIMHILLTSLPPFNGSTDMEILNKISLGVRDLNTPQWKSLTKEAKDMINQLLERNPSKRISAEEALNHPWFLMNKTKENYNYIKPEKNSKDY
jgi:calcium-dependent protein kinase